MNYCSHISPDQPGLQLACLRSQDKDKLLCKHPLALSRCVPCGVTVICLDCAFSFNWFQILRLGRSVSVMQGQRDCADKDEPNRAWALWWVF